MLFGKIWRREDLVILSHSLDSIAIITTPSIIPDTTLKKSVQLLDSSRSGKTVTRAIWMKPPLVKGIIQEVALSTTSKLFRPSADSEPIIPSEAV